MADDQQLLRDFAHRYSQEAFTLLVQRHVNLVYSSALRQLGGDSHLAWDASQSVFLALAQNASRLVEHRALTGWLYTTTLDSFAQAIGLGEKFAEASGVGDLPATITDEVIAQAQPVLSPAQVGILRQIQSEQSSQADVLRTLGKAVRDSQQP